MKPLIYIAGPYTNPDPVVNTRNAIDVGMLIVERFDSAVIIPHLTMFVHLIEPRDIEFWYQFDLDQLEHCDALWRMSGRSAGADKEVDFANRHSIPVFYDLIAFGNWRSEFK